MYAALWGAHIAVIGGIWLVQNVKWLAQLRTVAQLRGPRRCTVWVHTRSLQRGISMLTSIYLTANWPAG